VNTFTCSSCRQQRNADLASKTSGGKPICATCVANIRELKTKRSEGVRNRNQKRHTQDYSKGSPRNWWKE